MTDPITKWLVLHVGTFKESRRLHEILTEFTPHIEFRHALDSVTDIKLSELRGIIWAEFERTNDALAVCRRWRFDAPQLPLLLLGKPLHENELLDLFDTGITDYLAWPLNINSALLKIRLKNYWQLANAIHHTFSIPERIREENVQQALHHFATTSRLSSIGEMTTMMAHELNQPLTAVLSFAEVSQRLLERSEPTKEELKHTISRIIHNAKLTANIIRHIREWGRRGRLLKKPTQLNGLIVETKHIVKRDLLRQSIELKLKLIDPSPLLEIDYYRIQHVLLNLIYNSAEAICSHAATVREITIEAQEQSRFIEIKVSDTGPGIATELFEQLFRRFVSSKAEGLGMNLAVCRSLIEAHGGDLWIDSQTPIGGACVHFTLPLKTTAKHSESSI
jgi:C4-dicarboxylate-specific signal transduction histidine kinase